MKVRVKVDSPNNFTQDPVRYKEGLGKNGVKAGDILEVEPSSQDGYYKYSSAGGYVNLIRISKTEVIAEMTTYAIGDKFKVVKEPPSPAYQTVNRNRFYGNPTGKDFPLVGEILTVYKIVNETPYYINGGGNPNAIPVEYVEKVTVESPPPQYKVGDKVRAKEDWDGAWTSDPARANSVTPNDRHIRKGDILTVALAGTDYIYYQTGKDDVRHHIKHERIEPYQEAETVTTGFKAGDVVRVVRGPVPHQCYSTDRTTYHNSGPNDRLQVGETFTIVNSGGVLQYENGGGYRSKIPVGFIEYVTVPPGRQQPKIFVGDWVRALKVSSNQRTTSWWRDGFYSRPRDEMRIGEVFKVITVANDDNSSLTYNTGARGQQNTIPADWVEVVHDYDRLAVPKRVLLTFLASTPVLGVMSMHNLMQALSTDPIVHKSIVGLIVTLCGTGGAMAVLHGGKACGRALAQAKDRGRRIKKEDNQTQAEMIAAAIQASNAKKA